MDCFEEVFVVHASWGWMWMKRRVVGIDPRAVLHSDVFCHEWRRRFPKGLIRSWVNGLEERCVKEGGKER